jgi:hypothetical protein
MSFDSFQTSGNSPGCGRSPDPSGFGPAGSAVAGGLIERLRLSDFTFASILDLAHRSTDRSLHEHKNLVGAGLQSGPTFAEAV